MTTAPEAIRAWIDQQVKAQGLDEEEESEDLRYEIESEFRYSGEPCQGVALSGCYSRHYECDIVCRKLGDRWVAWPYWHGGGKHGEPESIEWIDAAVFVEVAKEEMVVKRTFRVANALPRKADV